VREGDVSAAIVIPEGARTELRRADRSADRRVGRSSNPVASQIVTGLLQKAAMTAAPEVTFRSDIELFEKYAGTLTPQQKAAVDSWEQELHRRSTTPQAKTEAPVRPWTDRSARDRRARRATQEPAHRVLRRRHRDHVTCCSPAQVRRARCSTRWTRARSTAC
jgi:hypothetical protein